MNLTAVTISRYEEKWNLGEVPWFNFVKNESIPILDDGGETIKDGIKFYRYPRTCFGIRMAKYLRRLEGTFLSIWPRLHFNIWIPYYCKLISVPHYEVEG